MTDLSQPAQGQFVDRHWFLAFADALAAAAAGSVTTARNAMLL